MFQKAQIEKITKSLKTLLANTKILYVKTQNFHWNVVDVNFLPLHEMFQKQYEELAEAIDLIAERIRFFGVKAPGSLKEFLKLATLEESEKELKAPLMIKNLLKDHEEMSQFLIKGIKEIQDLGDEATADIYIERLRVHDKTSWILKSHLVN
jgi:starvation-inducible DNA-binding protein